MINSSCQVIPELDIITFSINISTSGHITMAVVFLSFILSFLSDSCSCVLDFWFSRLVLLTILEFVLSDFSTD